MYFNKTAYNGLFRVNRAGQFNVPLGRYVMRWLQHVRCCDVRSCEPGDYRVTLQDVERRDLVYLYSPHDIRSKTASFTSYTSHAFAQADQFELAGVVRELVARGAHVIARNADTGLVRKRDGGVMHLVPGLQRLHA